MHITNIISDQKGGVGAGFIFAVVIIGVFGYFYFYPTEFPELLPPPESKQQLCRPYLQPNGDIMPDAPEIMAPSYEQNLTDGQRYPVVHQDQKPYRLIKANVPILRDVVHNYFDINDLRNVATNSAQCNPSSISDEKGYHHHFCQWIHEPLKITPNFSKADQYVVFYPAPYSDGNTTDRYIGGTDPFQSEMSNDEVIRYGTYHILFLPGFA
jgi:hypothetical protein